MCCQDSPGEGFGCIFLNPKGPITIVSLQVRQLQVFRACGVSHVCRTRQEKDAVQRWRVSQQQRSIRPPASLQRFEDVVSEAINHEACPLEDSGDPSSSSGLSSTELAITGVGRGRHGQPSGWAAVRSHQESGALLPSAGVPKSEHPRAQPSAEMKEQCKELHHSQDNHGIVAAPQARQSGSSWTGTGPEQSAASPASQDHITVDMVRLRQAVCLHLL